MPPAVWQNSEARRTHLPSSGGVSAKEEDTVMSRVLGEKNHRSLIPVGMYTETGVKEVES